MQENMDKKIRVCPNSPCNVTHGLKEFKINSPKKSKNKLTKTLYIKTSIIEFSESQRKKPRTNNKNIFCAVNVRQQCQIIVLVWIRGTAKQGNKNS